MLRTSSDARIVCINPNLVLQKNDLFTTGIVFMPFGLAYFSGTLIKEGYNCQVVDAFGENPNQIWKEGDFVFRGLQPLEIVDQIKIGSTETPKVFFIYAINLTYHCATLNIIKQLNNSFPSVPIAVLENTQAVTGYSLEEIQDEFYANGATYVVMGEPEERGVALIKYILSKRKNIACLNIDGIGLSLIHI